jgi:hypothetical protein
MVRVICNILVDVYNQEKRHGDLFNSQVQVNFLKD